MPFLNKVVLITGAASGFGEAIALKFAKKSARLALIDKNKAALNKSADNCEKVSKTKVFRIVADLTKDDEVQAAIDSTVKQYGKIDVVVNCAGIFRALSILEPNVIDIFDDVVAINLRAIVSVTSSVAPVLVESKGCIINVSSISGNITVPGTLIYSATKAGLAHFTRAAAKELAEHGVRVNSISPGSLKTNLLTNSDPSITQKASDKFWEKSKDLTALKRMVKTDDAAELVAFLASEKAVGITGSDFLIDAGRTLLPQQLIKI